MNPDRLAPKPATAFEVVFRHESARTAEAGILVPVLDGARFLRDSLPSACRQTNVSLEIVVIDDGSLDDSAAVAAGILATQGAHLARALVVRHAVTAGPAAARDTGMRQLTSPAALLLDADNIIYPRSVRRCLDALNDSDAAFVYPILRMFGERTGLLGVEPFNKERLGCGNYIDTLALVRRSAWETVGGFPDLPEGLEDYAFWLALADHGLDGAQVPEILGAYRTHRSNRTHNAHARMGAIFRRLKAAHPWITLPHLPPENDPAP